MTDKMREEFEVWALGRFINSETMRPMDRDPEEPEEYRYSLVNMAWIAWQASREVVVVELPKVVGFEGAYDSLRDHEFCPRMSDVEDADEVFSLCRRIEVQEAIEALGLKVKP